MISTRFRHWPVFAIAVALALYPVIAFAAEDNPTGLIPDSNVGRWSAVIGFFLPLLIAVINRKLWPSWAKAVTTFIVAGFVATGTAYFAGTFSQSDLVSSFLVVTLMAIGTYSLVWKPGGITPGIEKRT